MSVISFANIFSPLLGCIFILLEADFLCCAKAFKFDQVPFVYFCFYFFCHRRQIQKSIAMIYVKECSTYVLFTVCYCLCCCRLIDHRCMLLFLGSQYWSKVCFLPALWYFDSCRGFPGGTNGKESPVCQCRRFKRQGWGGGCSIPGSGRSPGGGNSNPFWYSSWEKVPWIEETGGL